MRLPPGQQSVSTTLWFLPSQKVLQPPSCRIWPTVAHSSGMRLWAPGNPVAASVMAAQPLRWWLRPVRSVERVGEHSAVVCHCEYINPLSASLCNVGMLILPPNGDQAACPVSS